MFQPPSRAGTKLAGKYQLEVRIGIGGVSEVYRARNLGLDRLVAIKMLLPDCAIHESVRAKFLKEAQTATLVRHKNVLDLYDIEADEVGVPFVVQEYLQGQSLADHAEAKGGRLEASEAMDLLLPIADALAEMHARGLVHRDVKPSNVFLSQIHNTCVPKLVDFGSSTEEKRGVLRSTAIGAEQGTPAYMSPDQIRDPSTVGPGTDIWSFGVMLFEMLAGTLPFEGTHARALAINIATAEMRPIHDHVPALSQELAQLIMTCLRKTAAERYPSGRDLHSALTLAARAQKTGLVVATRRAVSAVASTELGIPVLNLATGTGGGTAPAIRKIATQTGGVVTTMVDGSRNAVMRSTFVGNEAPGQAPNPVSGTLMMGGRVEAEARAPDFGRSTHHGVGGPIPSLTEQAVRTPPPVMQPEFDDVTSAYDARTVEALGLGAIPDLAKPSHVTKRAANVEYEPTVRMPDKIAPAAGAPAPLFEPTLHMQDRPPRTQRQPNAPAIPTAPMAEVDPGRAPPSLELDLPPKNQSDRKMKAASSAKLPATAPSAVRNPPTPPEDDDDSDFGDSFQFGFNTGPAQPDRASSSAMRANIPFDTGPSSQKQAETTTGSLGRANMHVVPGTFKGEAAWVNVAGPVLHVALWLGVIFGLMRLVYNPAGYSVTSLVPAAFDGSSMLASGVTSLLALALCVALGIGAFRGEHRTYGLLVSALGGMLVGMAMITVTLSSSGETAAPPDGAILVPYLAPLLTVGLSIGMMEWAFWQWRTGIGSRRAASIAFAFASGALAFFTVELSPLGRLFG